MADVVHEAPQPTTPLQCGRILGFTSLSVWFVGALVCLASQIRQMTRYARLVRRGAIAPLHLNQEEASVASRLRMKLPVCIVVRATG